MSYKTLFYFFKEKLYILITAAGVISFKNLQKKAELLCPVVYLGRLYPCDPTQRDPEPVDP